MGAADWKAESIAPRNPRTRREQKCCMKLLLRSMSGEGVKYQVTARSISRTGRPSQSSEAEDTPRPAQLMPGRRFIHDDDKCIVSGRLHNLSHVFRMHAASAAPRPSVPCGELSWIERRVRSGVCVTPRRNTIAARGAADLCLTY